MSGEKVLTKQIAEQFLADVDSVGLSEFPTSEDDVAESLSDHKGALSRRPDQPLDEAAESLSRHKGGCLTTVAQTLRQRLHRDQLPALH